jgi:hypothetical protein
LSNSIGPPAHGAPGGGLGCAPWRARDHAPTVPQTADRAGQPASNARRRNDPVVEVPAAERRTFGPLVTTPKGSRTGSPGARSRLQTRIPHRARARSATGSMIATGWPGSPKPAARFAVTSSFSWLRGSTIYAIRRRACGWLGLCGWSLRVLRVRTGKPPPGRCTPRWSLFWFHRRVRGNPRGPADAYAVRTARWRPRCPPTLDAVFADNLQWVLDGVLKQSSP